MKHYNIIITICIAIILLSSNVYSEERTDESISQEKVVEEQNATPEKDATKTEIVEEPEKIGVPITEISSIELNKENAQKIRLAISLKDVIFLTFANNLNIKIEKISEDIADAEINVQKGLTYDALFQMSFVKSDEEKQTPYLATYGNTVSKSNANVLDTSITQTIPTGAYLTLSYFDQRIRANSSSIDPELNPYYEMGSTISINQPLLKNFGPFMTNSQIIIAKNNKKISTSTFMEQAITQIAEITSLYWELYFARENLKFQEISLEQAKSLLRVNKAKVREGVLPPTYEIQAEADVVEREKGLIEAEAQIRDLEDQIKRKTNLSENTGIWDFELYPIDSPSLAPITVDIEETMEITKEKNPIINKYKYDYINKTVEERIAKNQRLPQLDLFASAGLTGLNDSNSDSFDDMYGNDYDNWSAGVSLSFPIPNRAARYRYKQAKLAREGVKLALEDLENELTLEARTTARQVETNLKQIEAGEKDVIAQEKKLDSEQKRYDVGLATSQDVLDYQQDLQRARSSRVRAIVDYNISQVKLEAIKGTLLEKNGIVVKEE